MFAEDAARGGALVGSRPLNCASLLLDLFFGFSNMELAQSGLVLRGCVVSWDFSFGGVMFAQLSILVGWLNDSAAVLGQIYAKTGASFNLQPPQDEVRARQGHNPILRAHAELRDTRYIHNNHTTTTQIPEKLNVHSSTGRCAAVERYNADSIKGSSTQLTSIIYHGIDSVQVIHTLSSYTQHLSTAKMSLSDPVSTTIQSSASLASSINSTMDAGIALAASSVPEKEKGSWIWMFGRLTLFLLKIIPVVLYWLITFTTITVPTFMFKLFSTSLTFTMNATTL